TDIMLGGNAEFLAVAEMEERGLDPQEDEEQYEAEWQDVLKAAEKRVKTEAKEVIEAGGLYVLGTERHESRRIDNQLRGRSGRQGDPGESRFYLSLTDDLMRLFGSGAAERIMATANVPDDVPLESKMVSRAILSAQSQIEQRNAEQRKNVLKYDDVLNRQRTVIYDERRSVLDGADLEEQVSKFREEVIDAYVVEATTGPVEDWKVDELFEALGKIYEPSITEEDLADEVGGIGNLTKNRLNREIQSDIKVFYEQREEALGEEATRELERRVVLSVIDKRWREHLYEMDYLKNGIGLRAMAQKDPLVEYQREGFDMFKTMQDGIREDVVRLTNTLQVTVNRSEDESDDDSDVEVDAAELRHTTPKMQLSAPSESGSSAMSESEDDEAETDQPANRAQRRAKKKAKS
ncbi:MAG: preprotein translocase subunit SecA, partial [Brevibacterium sp.]|nr:preprotein translocase subunit SecA [Brevibacterium sp.]